MLLKIQTFHALTAYLKPPTLLLQRHLAVLRLKNRVFDTDIEVDRPEKYLNGVVVL
jgi:hypothetical protein